MTLLAVVCAVAAMLVNSAATLLEAAGSSRVRPRRPLPTQPLYLLGLLVDGVGWALSVVALRVLPVFAVQAVLAGSVAVTAVAARGGDPRALRGPERAGVVAVLVGLVAVATSAAPGPAPALPAAGTAGLGLVALAAVVAVPLLRRRGGGGGRRVLTAVVAGACNGGAALCVRAVHGASTRWASVVEVVGEPLAWAVAVYGACGALLLASALRGASARELGTVAAAVSATSVVLPGLVGIALLGDGVQAGRTPVLAVGLALAVAGVVVLARGGTATRLPALHRR